MDYGGTLSPTVPETSSDSTAEVSCVSHGCADPGLRGRTKVSDDHAEACRTIAASRRLYVLNSDGTAPDTVSFRSEKTLVAADSKETYERIAQVLRDHGG